MTRKSTFWGAVSVFILLGLGCLAPSDDMSILTWLGMLGTGLLLAAAAATISKYYDEKAKKEADHE